MDISTSYYINPNTQGITSNISNTAIKGKDTNKQAMSNLLRPVENLVDSLKTPMKLAASSSLDRRNNSVNIGLGASINVPGGFTLTVRERAVEVGGVCNYDNQKEWQDAHDMAGALATLLRNAGGTMKEVGYSTAEKNAWNENVQKVLGYFGVDTSRDFTVNGMHFARNQVGVFESEASSEAKLAYERMSANNRTYEFADEKTKKRLEQISSYYLENVPNSIRSAWQETLEETGINPFQTGFQSTLTQLSVEQDFMTGGDDDLFGNSKESCLAAINKILERIENPLGAVDENKSAFLEQEKVFYSTLSERINALED